MKNSSIYHKFIERLEVAFRVRLCHLIDKLAIITTKPKEELSFKKSLLLIRLDAIGDYILFRNFLEKVRQDEKYKNYKITLCGNQIWKPLFEEWDKDNVDETIWIDRKNFYKDPFYRLQKQRQIRKQNFDTVLESTYSRLLLFGDAIAKISTTKQKIANKGNTDNLIPKEKRLADSYYTSLIDTSDNILFEFDRNKVFFEKFLEKKIDLNYPSLAEKIKAPARKTRQVALFVGASEVYKTWQFQNFAKLMLELQKINKKLRFILLGGKNEQSITQNILKYIKESPDNFDYQSKITDLTGKTNLIELTQKIAQSQLLITNETVASHLGTSTQTPTICVANGRHIGRFSPYPKSYNLPISYVFPPQIENELAQEEQKKIYEKYCNSMGLDINSISVSRVMKEITSKKWSFSIWEEN